MKPASPAMIAVVSLVALLCSCDGPTRSEEEGTPSAEACEHTQEGPSNAVTASAVADTTAGDVGAAHTRHDVTLAAVDGRNGGFVRFDSAGGPTIIFVSLALPLVASDDDGAALALTAVDETACAEVVKSFSGDMPVGVVFLELGPTDATAVSIVVEALDDEAGEG